MCQLIAWTFTTSVPGTHKDADFLGEAQKQNLEISPLPGEQIAGIIAQAYRLSPGLVARYVMIQEGGK